MSDSIRILLIDDQTTIRQALQILLEQEPGFEIVGGAADGIKGLAMVEALQPDIALVDIEMPKMNGIETTELITERFPKTKVLVLSGQDDQEYLTKAVQVGAKGYLLKTTPAEDLAYAIRSVYRGYSQISPGLLERMVVASGASTQTDFARSSVAPAPTQPSASSTKSHPLLEPVIACSKVAEQVQSITKDVQAKLETLLRGNRRLLATLNE
jgi:DNA-binding NarL/FixJ family response regulator